MDADCLIGEVSAQGEETLRTIGEISALYNVTLRALRFYEGRKLLSPRRQGVARLYDAAAIRRLELILKGKRLGFTLSEIRDMVSASDAGAVQELRLDPEQVSSQIDLLVRQRAEIELAIGELEARRAQMAHVPDMPCAAPMGEAATMVGQAA